MTGDSFPRAGVLLAALVVAGLAVPGEGTARPRPAAGTTTPAAGGSSFDGPPAATARPSGVRIAADGDCSGAAAQAAADSGGQVLSVSSRRQGGRTVCVVTLLVPGEEGSRPRKKTITLPQ